VDDPVVSVVVPVYRNRETLAALCDGVERAVAGLGAFELILVDDASPDDAWREILSLVRARGSVRGVRLDRNRGQHVAVLVGFGAARANALISMDADLQDPPAAIPALVAGLEGAQVSFAGRFGTYQSPFRMLSSRLYRACILRAIGVPRDAGMFFAIRADARDRLLNTLIPNPSVLGLIAGLGLSCVSQPVARSVRAHGRSAYTFGKRVRSCGDLVRTWLATRAPQAPDRRAAAALRAYIAEEAGFPATSDAKSSA
jgi:glycosyltransferase involved in cell wall biosynthesis